MTKVSVLFVCLGNICRSPTAEGVFRSLLKKEGLADQVQVDSAGTAAYHSGERADRRSRAHAKKRGYSLDSLARQFMEVDFDHFDYVLAMDEQNLRDLQAVANSSGREPQHLGLFRDFDQEGQRGQSVPDPYYGGGLGFEEVLNQCERACRGLIEHLQKNELA